MSKERDKFDLEERLIEFAVRVIRVAESLPKTKTGNHISEQLSFVAHDLILFGLIPYSKTQLEAVKSILSFNLNL